MNTHVNLVMADGSPRLHQLLVPATDDHPAFGYLVVEVTPSSFVEGCDYINGTRWLDHGLAPLVVSHFPPSEAETRQLPSRVPWIRAAPSVHAQLEQLRNVLVVPLLERGLVCVDFADLVVTLAHGGEARLAQASGLTMALACNDLLSDATFQEWISAADMAVFLHIRFGGTFNMSDFELAEQRLEYFVAPESLLVLSEGTRKGNKHGVELTLLAVSRRKS